MPKIMRNILNIVFSICLFGVFLIPADVLACSAHTAVVTQPETSCCEQSEASCCEDQESEESDCSSRCNAKSCHNASHAFGVQTGGKHGLNMFLSGLKKSYPIYQQSYFPSGIPSIWQPPKIG